MSRRDLTLLPWVKIIIRAKRVKKRRYGSALETPHSTVRYEPDVRSGSTVRHNKRFTPKVCVMTSNFYISGAAALTSNDDSWTTPPDFYAKWNSKYNFVLDAAASSQSALCEKWYGLDHPNPEYRNALERDWHKDAQGGAVWLNPPYGRTIGLWMRKAHTEAQLGATVVCLVPSRTDTSWFHDYCIQHEYHLLRGRLKFGGSKNSAPFPSLVVVMRP